MFFVSIVALVFVLLGYASPKLMIVILTIWATVHLVMRRYHKRDY